MARLDHLAGLFDEPLRALAIFDAHGPRRTVDAALAPARRQFRPAAFKTLSRALALVVGTEAMLALKDVLQLDDTEARRVRRWAMRALIDAARQPAPAG